VIPGFLLFLDSPIMWSASKKADVAQLVEQLMGHTFAQETQSAQANGPVPLRYGPEAGADERT
jgi:hypothetical protein